ncbi:MAG: ATP-binding cassette domain-containing protein [Microbacteriaceae bacterium]
MDTFIRFTLLGMGTGACYSLLALGLVVVYRGSGVINFATGAQALFAAGVFVDTRDQLGAWPAAVLAVVTSGIVGGLIHIVIMRQLRRSSPLMRVVATLALLGVAREAALKRYGLFPQRVRGIVPDGSAEIFGVTVGEDRMWFIAIAAVLYLVLFLMYRRSRFGLATAGVAENEVATATLGWSPNVIASANWALGGVLAGIAGVLLVPLSGLHADSLALAVVPALAASLVGGFRSFPVTYAAALAIGVMESHANVHITARGWATAVPFIVIIAVLVVRGKTLPVRSHITDRLPRLGGGSVRWQGLVAVMAVLVGISGLSGSWATAINIATVYALVCLSLVVVTGYAGQLSLAQFAFAGLGALISSRLGDAAGLPFILALVIAVVIAVPIGAIIALPAVRVRGVNLAVVSMGLSVVVSAVILGNPSLTGGAIRGTVLPRPSLFGWDIFAAEHADRYAWVGLGVLALAIVVVGNLRRSQTGRRLVAVRGNERAAASLGINVVESKLYAFALSAALAAAAGVLLAFRETYVTFDRYNVFTSINTVVLTVIGGIGWIIGGVIGGLTAPGGVAQNFFEQWWSVESWFPLIGAALTVPVVVLHADGIAADLAHGGRLLRARLARTGGKLVHTRMASIDRTSEAAPPVHHVIPQQFEFLGVTVQFGGVVAVDDVSFRIEPGQVVGLIGPNGAGKTTLIDAATGYVTPKHGSVRIGGRDITSRGAAERARLGVCRSFQSLELFDDLSVLENISVGGARSRTALLTDLVRPSRPSLSPAARAAVDEFELWDVLDRRPGELPYAQRRLVAIARAVASGPSVLLLDEPAAGLDAVSSRELGHLIRRLAHEWGMGVLLIEHDVQMVLSTCDWVVALNFGAHIGAGTPDAIRNNAAVVAAYLGTPEGHVGPTSSGEPAAVNVEAATAEGRAR